MALTLIFLLHLHYSSICTKAIHEHWHLGDKVNKVSPFYNVVAEDFTSSGEKKDKTYAATKKKLSRAKNIVNAIDKYLPENYLALDWANRDIQFGLGFEKFVSKR